MSKSAESTIARRKLSPTEKQECYSVFAELRQKMYGGVAKIAMTAEEFEVLDYFYSYPISTIQELQGKHEFLKNAARIVKKLTKGRLLRQRSGYVSLTRLGFILRELACELLYPVATDQPDIRVALCPNPHIEGRVTLTPTCDYNPLCSETPALNGVLVTFVNGPDPSREHRVELEHRNYCCELHAAFDLLRKVAEGTLCLYEDEATMQAALTDMARRSLNGEALLGDKVSQSEINSEVDRILGSGGPEPTTK